MKLDKSKIIVPTQYLHVSWLTEQKNNPYHIGVADIKGENLSGVHDLDVIHSYIKHFVDSDIVKVLNWNVYSKIDN